jgi:Tol biopolymer transport system component
MARKKGENPVKDSIIPLVRRSRTRWVALLAAAVACGLTLLLAGAALAAPGTIVVCSTSTAGVPGADNSLNASISANGRFVAFQSNATNLVAPATTGTQVFRKDLVTGNTVLVSATAAGVQGSGNSTFPTLNANGRYVAFISTPTNLLGAATTHTQVFRKDLETGAIVLVSATAAGAEGNNDVNSAPSIDAEGEMVALTSTATNLLGALTTHAQAFRKNLSTGAIVLVSATAAGVQGNDNSGFVSISGEGRYVALATSATNLIPVLTANMQIFRKDLDTGAIVLVSASTAGVMGNNGSMMPSISTDGRYVGITSTSTNLVTPATTNQQIFIKDVASGKMDLVSANAAGVVADNNCAFPSVSADGDYVAFSSIATNLVTPATTVVQVFRKQMSTGVVNLVSANVAGGEGDAQATNFVDRAMTPEGRYVVFNSAATNLVTPATTNSQVFRKELPVPFYFAEGTCRPGFDPYLTIQNPGTVPAAVKITYMKGDGSTMDQALTVAPHSRSTVTVKQILGEGDDAAHDFSSKVQCMNGQAIIAERPMYFNYKPNVLNWNGGSDVVGALSPGPTFFFAEGTCRPGFDPYLTIQNPGAADAAVTITYYKGDSTTATQTLTVPAHARSTVTVSNTLGVGDDAAHDFSSKVHCTNGQVIVAERPMYFNYKPNVLNWNGGHDTVGAISPAPAFFFAEGTCRPGFDPYITIQNPGEADAVVKITYLKGDSATLDQNVTVPAHTRSTVTVKQTLGEGNDPAHDFSSKVVSTNGQPIIAERPMYFNYKPGVLNWTGGSDVVGALDSAAASYFAEGTGRPGFEPYLTIQNPGAADAAVKITYMKGDGSTLNQNLTVPAHSRSTVTVKQILGEGDDAAHDFSTQVLCTNGQRIIVERPMYFNYKPGVLNWNGGSDVVGLY